MKAVARLVVISILLTGCSSSENTPPVKRDNKIIQTVNGPIHSDSMGLTLIHEHVLVDFIGADQTGYDRWDREKVINKMLPYFLEVKDYGVQTIFETTPAFLGRDAILIKELSKRSGINFVTNTGYYGAVNDKYLPKYVFSASADSLASIWVSEFVNGIESTGITPGFMKISVDPDSLLSEVDKKIVIAATKAHKETGLTIVSHTGPDAPAFAQMELLKEYGVAAEAWVWTHAQDGTEKGRLKAARMGAWISLDNVMTTNIQDYVKFLMELKEASLLHRALISHDAGYYSPDDGDSSEIRGYSAIFAELIPALKTNGFSDSDINQLLIQNPIEAYTIRKRLSR